MTSTKNAATSLDEEAATVYDPASEKEAFDL